jgi:GNAT superfamily N-acetyltransferase
MSDQLARKVEQAQAIAGTPAAALARRLEQVVAEGGRMVAAAMRRADPSSGAGVLEVAGGLAIFAGAGSPVTQALAMGLEGPLDDEDLDRTEAFLRPGATTVQMEICPFADVSLPRLLAARRYQVHEWQQVWVHDLAEIPGGSSEVELRPVQPGEEDLFVRTITRAFLEGAEPTDQDLDLLRPVAFAEKHELYLALLGGEVVGGGTIFHHHAVAYLAGTGVLPSARGRGAQGALIRQRLARARALGCSVAASSTLPGTTSHQNMERHGFRAAYPKLVMLRRL